MRFVSTKTHGILDYIVGIVLIIAPWLFGFAEGGAAQWTAIIVGILILAQAMFTNYEVGIVKEMPMSLHLTVDVIIGIFLAVSPWLLGYAHVIWWPHLLVGLVILFFGLFTKTTPVYTDVKV